jgi:hypothetical protein
MKIANKHDADKPDYSLLPQPALNAIAQVLSFGAKKYGAHNWRNGLEYRRLIAACLRHITIFNEGEDCDSESGLSHIAHALCCLVFLATQIHYKNGVDDRYKHNYETTKGGE